MVKKRCVNCGKNFSCEEECVKAGIFIEGVLTERSCFCPDCARQEDMKRRYTEQLRNVCPRFTKSREKVSFT
jgi:hypothetical protein